MSEEKALYKKAVHIKDGEAMVNFKALPYGNYAFAFFHDENSNDKLDKTLVGVPKEGFGFSNNARGTFGPPSYKKSSFSLNSTSYLAEVELNYMLN